MINNKYFKIIKIFKGKIRSGKFRKHKLPLVNMEKNKMKKKSTWIDE